MALLTCNQIRKEYKGFSLSDISFSIPSGYLTGLIGVNGAGKTTLMNALASFDLSYEGEVLLDGSDVKRNLKAAKNQITLISDEVDFFLDKSPLDNALLLGPYFDHFSVEKFYTYLDHFGIDKQTYLYQYSKGMRMKFQVAFALAHDVKFLLLDEPTAGFDVVFRRDFLGLLRELLACDIGILMSTHITSDLDAIADYLVVIDDGKLIVKGEKDLVQTDSERCISSHVSGRDFHVGEYMKRNRFARR